MIGRSILSIENREKFREKFEKQRAELSARSVFPETRGATGEEGAGVSRSPDPVIARWYDEVWLLSSMSVT